MPRDEREFGVGVRVRLNRLGLSRSPKIGPRSGVVESVGPTGNTIRVLFDTGRASIAIHRSYLELSAENT